VSVRALVAAVLLALGLPACSSSAPSRAASTTTRAVAPTSAPPPTSGPPTEPSDALAAEAYVWGVPLVVSTRTAQSLARLVGVDRLFNQQQLTTPGVRLVVAPNVDTLYSIAVLDLRHGAVKLTVPSIRDRYYTYQFLDAYTNSFAYLGTRATGGEAGTWFVAPPHWNGALPAGDHLVRAPTPIVFLLGRFLVDGPSDLPALRAVMAQVRLSATAHPDCTRTATVPSISCCNTTRRRRTRRTGSPYRAAASGWCSASISRGSRSSAGSTSLRPYCPPDDQRVRAT